MPEEHKKGSWHTSGTHLMRKLPQKDDIQLPIFKSDEWVCLSSLKDSDELSESINQGVDNALPNLWPLQITRVYDNPEFGGVHDKKP